MGGSIVTISFHPERITCSAIAERPGKSSYALRAYHTTPLENFALAGAVIYNPTFLQRIITAFLQTYNLQNAWVICSAAGNGIVESIVELATTTPSRHDFHFPKLATIAWDYRYLYTTDTAHAAFYICGISRALLCQYQLFAHRCNLNLVALTTERMALLYLYTKLQGSAFRHSKLGHDLGKQNQNIHNLFTTDILNRMLTGTQEVGINVEQEKESLLVALALYRLGKEYYGAY